MGKSVQIGGEMVEWPEPMDIEGLVNKLDEITTLLITINESLEEIKELLDKGKPKKRK